VDLLLALWKIDGIVREGERYGEATLERITLMKEYVRVGLARVNIAGRSGVDVAKAV